MKSSKGAAYERELAKAFGRWWTSSDREDVFWRSSNSGGRATVRRKAGHSTYGHCGDLAAVDPIGVPLLQAVTIELKCGYTKCTFADAVDRSPHLLQSEWEGFVEQARKAARNAGTPHWLLITRRSKRQSLVFMPLDLALVLRERGSLQDISSVRLDVFIKTAWKKLKRTKIMGFLLSDFFLTVKPRHFRGIT